MMWGWSCHRAGLWSTHGLPFDEKERKGFLGAGAGGRVQKQRRVPCGWTPGAQRGAGEAESTVVWGVVTEELI